MNQVIQGIHLPAIISINKVDFTLTRKSNSRQAIWWVGKSSQLVIFLTVWGLALVFFMETRYGIFTKVRLNLCISSLFG